MIQLIGKKVWLVNLYDQHPNNSHNLNISNKLKSQNMILWNYNFGFFFNTGDWTQDLFLATQVHYHLSHTHSLSVLVIFKSIWAYAWVAWNMILLFVITSQLGWEASVECQPLIKMGFNELFACLGQNCNPLEKLLS
jgi:hypothetical protein